MCIRDRIMDKQLCVELADQVLPLRDYEGDDQHEQLNEALMELASYGSTLGIEGGGACVLELVMRAQLQKCSDLSVLERLWQLNKHRESLIGQVCCVDPVVWNEQQGQQCEEPQPESGRSMLQLNMCSVGTLLTECPSFTEEDLRQCKRKYALLSGAEGALRKGSYLQTLGLPADCPLGQLVDSHEDEYISMEQWARFVYGYQHGSSEHRAKICFSALTQSAQDRSVDTVRALSVAGIVVAEDKMMFRDKLCDVSVVGSRIKAEDFAVAAGLECASSANTQKLPTIGVEALGELTNNSGGLSNRAQRSSAEVAASTPMSVHSFGDSSAGSAAGTPSTMPAAGASFQPQVNDWAQSSHPDGTAPAGTPMNVHSFGDSSSAAGTPVRVSSFDNGASSHAPVSDWAPSNHRPADTPMSVHSFGDSSAGSPSTVPVAGATSHAPVSDWAPSNHRAADTPMSVHSFGDSSAGSPSTVPVAGATSHAPVSDWAPSNHRPADTPMSVHSFGDSSAGSSPLPVQQWNPSEPPAMVATSAHVQQDTAQDPAEISFDDSSEAEPTQPFVTGGWSPGQGAVSDNSFDDEPEPPPDAGGDLSDNSFDAPAGMGGVASMPMVVHDMSMNSFDDSPLLQPQAGEPQAANTPHEDWEANSFDDFDSSPEVVPLHGRRRSQDHHHVSVESKPGIAMSPSPALAFQNADEVTGVEAFSLD
eukprot:TRINITY_DN6102_c0_g1_i11.p1 TRINITY_DN6102_c0_g1~~TRINITY_DN6102_c0_g1_i11.p1  ORF type:complete len:703 (-),score=159.39 TRINITY_DN6102_c0_g1_i11:139-2247(-)